MKKNIKIKFTTNSKKSGFSDNDLIFEPQKNAPLLWLKPENDAVMLINNTGEVLDYVKISHLGCKKANKYFLPCHEFNYIYDNIEICRALKVADYDGYYDLDFKHYICFSIKSKSIGCVNISTLFYRVCIGETVLIWDDFSLGKNVIMTDKIA